MGCGMIGMWWGCKKCGNITQINIQKLPSGDKCIDKLLTICWKLPVAKSYQPGQKHWNRWTPCCVHAQAWSVLLHLGWKPPWKTAKSHVAYVAQVRVAPTGAEEPTMDLRKLPLGIDVADPEVGPA